jgi:hypothetical protein
MPHRIHIQRGCLFLFRTTFISLHQPGKNEIENAPSFHASQIKSIFAFWLFFSIS